MLKLLKKAVSRNMIESKELSIGICWQKISGEIPCATPNVNQIVKKYFPFV